MNWKTLTANWKTSLTGFIGLLLSVPTFVSALQAWGAHQPVDWRQILVSTTITVISTGLLASKDSTTHSTVQEVEKSTQEATKVG